MSVHPASLLGVVLSFALAPLLGGVIGRTKALFAGRRGAPLLQGYFDAAKLLRKGAVYSTSTTWIFRAGPSAGAGAVAVALALVPMAGRPAPAGFPGDFLVLASLLALGRFLAIAAALDTASAFEGMGASREAHFSALAEPALLLSFLALARNAGSLSLSAGVGALSFTAWRTHAAALALVVAALFVVLLAESSRVPVDDPATHLELTMIHEVMVLDHGGPDLALVEVASWLKMWLLGALIVGVAVPVRTGSGTLDVLVFVAAMLGLAVLVGIVESTMARLRLLRVPQLLVAAGVVAALAVVLIPG